MTETTLLDFESELDTLLQTDLPEVLFYTDEVDSMEFCMQIAKSENESKVLKKFQKLVEGCGGSLTFNMSSGGLHMIKFVHSKCINFTSDDDLFLSKYLIDCVKESKLLDLNYYRASDTKFTNSVNVMDILNGAISWEHAERLQIEPQVSDFSDNEDAANSSPRKASTKKHFASKNKSYTMEEEKQIINYIIRNSYFYKVKGNFIWQRMEEKSVCAFRTWQSMRGRYLHHIIPKIKKFRLDPLTESKLLFPFRTDEDEPFDTLEAAHQSRFKTTFVKKKKNSPTKERNKEKDTNGNCADVSSTEEDTEHPESTEGKNTEHLENTEGKGTKHPENTEGMGTKHPENTKGKDTEHPKNTEGKDTGSPESTEEKDTEHPENAEEKDTEHPENTKGKNTENTEEKETDTEHPENAEEKDNEDPENTGEKDTDTENPENAEEKDTEHPEHTKGKDTVHPENTEGKDTATTSNHTEQMTTDENSNKNNVNNSSSFSPKKKNLSFVETEEKNQTICTESRDISVRVSTVETISVGNNTNEINHSPNSLDFSFRLYSDTEEDEDSNDLIVCVNEAESSLTIRPKNASYTSEDATDEASSVETVIFKLPETENHTDSSEVYGPTETSDEELPFLLRFENHLEQSKEDSSPTTSSNRPLNSKSETEPSPKRTNLHKKHKKKHGPPVIKKELLKEPYIRITPMKEMQSHKRNIAENEYGTELDEESPFGTRKRHKRVSEHDDDDIDDDDELPSEDDKYRLRLRRRRPERDKESPDTQNSLEHDDTETEEEEDGVKFLKRVKTVNYTSEDDITILNYLYDNKVCGMVKGRAVWEVMERRQLITGRSWHSLKERFRKRILPRIYSYKELPKQFAREFKKAVQEKGEDNEKYFRLHTLKYTSAEDDCIIKFIIENKRYKELKGKSMWVSMSQSKGLRSRTWESLKNRLLKNIMPNLKQFHLTPDQRRNFELGMKGKRKRKFDKPPPYKKENRSESDSSDSIHSEESSVKSDSLLAKNDSDSERTLSPSPTQSPLEGRREQSIEKESEQKKPAQKRKLFFTTFDCCNDIYEKTPVESTSLGIRRSRKEGAAVKTNKTADHVNQPSNSSIPVPAETITEKGNTALRENSPLHSTQETTPKRQAIQNGRTRRPTPARHTRKTSIEDPCNSSSTSRSSNSASPRTPARTLRSSPKAEKDDHEIFLSPQRTRNNIRDRDAERPSPTNRKARSLEATKKITNEEPPQVNLVRTTRASAATILNTKRKRKKIRRKTTFK